MKNPIQSQQVIERTLWLLALVGFLYALSLMLWYWPGALPIGPTSGVWCALAWDFAHGELYRPVWDLNGYGGTRYMPFFFILHGLAIKLGFAPSLSGVVLVQASVVVLAFGIYMVLRELQISRRIAFPLALLIFYGTIYQQICTAIKCDYLSAAFIVWSIFAIMRFDKQRHMAWISMAGLCMLGAFLTKITALYFWAPGIWFVWKSNRRAAAVLALIVLLGGLISLSLIELASHGHFSQNIVHGVFTARGNWDFTLRFAHRFLSELWYYHPDVGVLVALSTVWVIKFRKKICRHHVESLLLLFFWSAMICGAVILTAPGTNYNHLVDLQVASILIIGCIAKQENNWQYVAGLLFIALTIGLLSTLLPKMPSEFRTLSKENKNTLAVVEAIDRRFLASHPLCLAQNPLIQIQNGDRPVVADYAMAQVLSNSRNKGGEQLLQQIKQHKFSVIVFDDSAIFPHDILDEHDPLLEQLTKQYWNSKNDVLNLSVADGYRIAAVLRPYVVLVPKS